VAKKKVKNTNLTKAGKPKKKPGRKPKKKLYFGMEVQDAIVRYNALDQQTQQSERNEIYQTEIHAAFDKLCENIINTFKFEYFDDVYVDVKHEVLTFLVMNMHKYDHSKGSKAFSYFSVVAKNYLILHNNANYKRYKTHTGTDSLNNKSAKSNRKEYFNEFTEQMIEYFEQNISSMFKSKRDIDVAYAIIELMKQRDDIENFNKKALYVLIREMTNIDTSYITKVVNVFKKHYKILMEDFDSNGMITKNRNKFF
tara:strand:- start:269 stop:1030 length:762 start_codon:yes stop_codon:yes gene_type:complete